MTSNTPTTDPVDAEETTETTPSTETTETIETQSKAKIIINKATYVVILVVGILLGALLFSSDEPASTQDTEHHEDHAEDTVWTCSMDPQVRSSEPGQCPICGMDLVPASSLDDNAALSDSEISLTPRAKTLAKLVTTEVVPTVLSGQEHALSGQVVNDESSYKAITTWIDGRIDKLYINTTGEKIKRGQAMARMYSPEVYSAHQELLVAQTQVDALSSTPGNAFALQNAKTQLDAALQKLRLLGLRDADIKSMKTASKPWTNITIRSTFSGTVISRKAVEGQYVKRGDVLYELSDLDHVWVELDAYESDLTKLQKDQTVALQFDALPNETYTGTITFIDPVLNPKTRTSSVRIEVPNEDDLLKPGMFARAQLQPSIARNGEPLQLVIPQSAPLMAGERALVYVEKETSSEGTIYEAREVILGPLLDNNYVVRGGLKRGERVVSQGAFVLDSEMQIRGKLGLMSRPDDLQRQHTTSQQLQLTPAQRKELSIIITGYLDIQELLAADNFTQAIERSERWHTQIEAIDLFEDFKTIKNSKILKNSKNVQLVQAWAIYSRLFIADNKQLQKSQDLTTARDAFSYITQTMDRFLAKIGNVSDLPIRRVYCPMAHDNKGDHWYQRSSVVDNVYFGEQMRTCGEIQEEIAPGNVIVTDSTPLPTQGGHSHE